ncbi:MAG: class I SAM-dependent methyltransferase [Cyanobacteria bacterium P01_H01_bin.35]
MNSNKCRFCDCKLEHTFVDLGMSPLSNSFLQENNLQNAEKFYPLHTYVCSNCFLVQLEKFESPDVIFKDYAYFSSYSDTWLEHCKTYSNSTIDRFGLNKSSLVIELASNDGYLLQYFQQAGIPVLGIEPAANVAKVAEEKGIPSLVRFFGVEVAQELTTQGKQADLLIANNVLAHVPDLNSFVAGIAKILKPNGIFTSESPHLLELINNNQFDTIYHEHFSYYSFLTLEQIFAFHGITLFDVEEIPTHGGSLRIYGRHKEAEKIKVTPRVAELKTREIQAGLNQVETYLGFAEKVKATKRHLLSFLIDIKNSGQSIVGYGAPAKGNTLLNYCGIRQDFLNYTVDRSPHKQGLFLPGVHIPIYHPEKIIETRPDYVLILPWNIKNEIIQQMSQIREWGGKFIVPIPKVEVIS